MAVEQEEFKFPDEIPVTDNSDDVKVEIIDDTPEEDRGRKPLPKEVVEELEKDDLEEYSDKVKKRLSQMKKVWHDERREKESAKREREEALRFAQARPKRTRSSSSALVTARNCSSNRPLAQLPQNWHPPRNSLRTLMRLVTLRSLQKHRKRLPKPS